MSDDGPIEYAFRGLEPLDAVSLAFEHVAVGPLGVPLALLRAIVPLPQTVKGHLVIGLDMELGLLPPVPPAPPVTVPMPFIFIGLVDCAIGEIAVPRVGPPGSAPAADAKVTVYGLPATNAGKKATGIHIPMGVYAPMASPTTPKLKGETQLLYGSSSVDIDGAHAVRLGEMGMNCCFLGPLLTPTTRVLSIPLGWPVLTGGASVIDVGAMLTAVFDALVSAVVDSIFPGESFGSDLAKAYLTNVLTIIKDAAIIGMRRPRNEQESDAQIAEIEAKMMEIFTQAPFDALESATSDALWGEAGEQGAEHVRNHGRERRRR